MNFHYIFFCLDEAGYSVTSALISVLWQSTILLIAAGMLSWVLRKQTAALRHTIWTVAVFVLPLLPFLSMGTAKIGIPQTKIGNMTPYEVPKPARAFVSTSVMPIQPKETGTLITGAPVSTIVLTPPAPVANPSFREYSWLAAFSRYLIVAGALFAWIFFERRRMKRWIQSGTAVFDSRTLDVFHQAQQRLDLMGEIPIMEHPKVPAPLTFGIRHPVIMFPKGFAETLSDPELRTVAFHELTHVKRHDTLILTLAAFIRAVFFFQPLVWVAVRKISFYAELACDRSALKDGADPGLYAEFLTRVASALPRRSISAEVAAGILFSRSVFYKRVREILSKLSDRERSLTRKALAGVLLFGMAVLMVTLAFPLGYDEKSSMKWYGPKHVCPDGSWISGTIVYPDGWPVAGARFNVTWWEPGKLLGTTVSARADRQGRFRLDGIPLKIASWTFVANDVRRKYYTFPYIETNRSYTFVLREPDGFVSGRVIDESGKPVRGVSVDAESGIGPSGLLHSRVKTSWNGSFRLENLENEPHTIRAGKDEKGQGIVRNVPDKSNGITIVFYKSDFMKRIYTPHELKVIEYGKMHRKMGTASGGKLAPELAVSQWVNGNATTLSDIRGKIVVLFFWNKEDWDSIRPLVLLDYWKRNFGNQGVEFIAIHPYTTDIETVRKLAVERVGAIPVAIDRKSPVPEAQGETFDRYGAVVSGDSDLPGILVIDREGKIVSRGQYSSYGSFFDTEWVDEEIKKLLRKKDSAYSFAR